jgi:hypothetical protein
LDFSFVPQAQHHLTEGQYHFSFVRTQRNEVAPMEQMLY